MLVGRVLDEVENSGPAPIAHAIGASAQCLARSRKSLARTNKSHTWAEATKKRRRQRGVIWCAGQVSQRQDPLLGQCCGLQAGWQRMTARNDRLRTKGLPPRLAWDKTMEKPSD